MIDDSTFHEIGVRELESKAHFSLTDAVNDYEYLHDGSDDEDGEPCWTDWAAAEGSRPVRGDLTVSLTRGGDLKAEKSPGAAV
jgi:hypothetical protein